MIWREVPLEENHRDFVPFDGDLPGSDDRPPEPPIEPRGPSGGGQPAPRSAFWFAPWFFGIAALVGIERVAMVLVTSPGLGVHVQLAGFAVFCTIVLGVTLIGGMWFAKLYGR